MVVVWLDSTEVDEDVVISPNSVVWANATSENADELDSNRMVERNIAPSADLFFK